MAVTGFIDQRHRRKLTGPKGRKCSNQRRYQLASDGRTFRGVVQSKYSPMAAMGSKTPTGPLTNTAIPMAAYIATAIFQEGNRDVSRPETAKSVTDEPGRLISARRRQVKKYSASVMKKTR